MEGCEVVAGQSVISCGNAPEVFEPAKHAFDGIATSIQIGREAVLPLAIGLWWNVRNTALHLDLMTYRVAVVTPVTMHHQVGWQTLKHGRCRSAVSNMSTGQHQAQRAAHVIAQDMDLGGASTTRATNCLGCLPLYGWPALLPRFRIAGGLLAEERFFS